MDFSALTPARFAGYDQGADFTGAAPVFALGDGVVTRVERGGSGWAGDGAILVYQLTSGPAKGRHVYVAEDFSPAAGLAIGSLVRLGQVLGQATGSGHAPGIEVGWARNAHGSAYGSTSDGKSGGAAPRYGQDFGSFVGGVKRPAGGVAGVKDTGQASATWGDWATAFLKRLGVPTSSDNERFVLGWMKAENPADTYAWNPLATTLRTRGATRSGGVQAYKDELSGIDATVQTIQSGQYGAVRRALASGKNSQATWDALRASPWDAGHYASSPKVPTVGVSDVAAPVVGSKKDSGGLTGPAGDLWNLPSSIVGGAAGAAGDAASAALGPVGDAAKVVVSGVEDVAIRFVYGFVGLLLGGFALVLIVRTVSGSPPSLPSGGGTGAAGAAQSAAGAARGGAAAAAETVAPLAAAV